MPVGFYQLLLYPPPTAAEWNRPIAELANAESTNLSWELNQPDILDFKMPANDYRNKQIKILETEVVLRRNRKNLFVGIPLRCSTVKGESKYQCVSLVWYFYKRFVGDAQRPNLINNPNFGAGATYSNGGAPPSWSEGSDNIEIIQVRETNGAQRGTRVLTLTETRVSEKFPKNVDYRGEWSATKTYKKNDAVKFNGKKYVATNNVAKGNDPPSLPWRELEPMPRHSHIYQLHTPSKRGERYTFAVWFYLHEYNGPSFEDRLIYLRCYNSNTGKELKGAVYKVDKNTPRMEWQRAEVSVLVPKDAPAATELRASMYCPLGTISYSATRMTTRDFLLRGETDLTVAAKKLVEHAQDPAFGKTDLRIATSGANTGKLTNKRYPHDEHANIFESLFDLTRGAGGIDYFVDEDTRTFKVLNPRGTIHADISLELGKNIADYAYEEDGSDTANAIVGLAPGEGSDREEVYKRSLGKFSGMAYEDVVAVRTHLKAMGEWVDNLVDRRNKVNEIPSVKTYTPDNPIAPGFSTYLIDKVRPGDWVNLHINEGRTQINGLVRIYGMELDPRTDVLTLRFNP